MPTTTHSRSVTYPSKDNPSAIIGELADLSMQVAMHRSGGCCRIDVGAAAQALHVSTDITNHTVQHSPQNPPSGLQSTSTSLVTPTKAYPTVVFKLTSPQNSPRPLVRWHERHAHCSPTTKTWICQGHANW